MNAAQPPEREDAESARDRRTANIVLVGFIILVVGGLWMMNAFFNQRAMNDCLAEGRRDCAPIAVPGR